MTTYTRVHAKKIAQGYWQHANIRPVAMFHSDLSVTALLRQIRTESRVALKKGSCAKRFMCQTTLRIVGCQII